MRNWANDPWKVLALGVVASVIATYVVRLLDLVGPPLLRLAGDVAVWLASSGELIVIVAAVLVLLRGLEARLVAGVVPRAARWLVHRAADRLPRPLRARFEEEWLAEVDAMRDRPITALMFASRLRPVAVKLA
jgi:hypothetical protein